MKLRLKAPRLVSLQNTDATAALGRAVPILHPAAGPTSSLGNDFDTETLQHVAGILREGDVSYLDVSGSTGQPIPRGPLVEALERLDPDVFSTKGNTVCTEPATVAMQPMDLPPMTHVAKSQAKDEFLPPKKCRRKRVRPQEVESRMERRKCAERLSECLLGMDIDAGGELEEMDMDLEDDVRRLRVLRGVSEEVFKANAFGALRFVSVDTVRSVLRSLGKLVRRGNVLLGDGDDEDSPSYYTIMSAIESGILGMQLLTAPHMPSQIQIEEVIDSIISSAKFHLETNVFVFYSLVHREIHRPTKADPEEGATPVGKRSRPARKSLLTNRVASELAGRMEILLQSIVELLKITRLDIAFLTPLLRIALQSLTIDSEEMTLIQMKSLALVTTAFEQYHDQQRDMIFDEVFSLFTASNVGSKRVARQYLADSAGEQYIQMTSALILQIVQVSIELPAFDVGSSEVGKCFWQVFCWADEFWKRLFESLPKAKIQKSEGQVDTKAVVESLLIDCMSVVNLPEWPAANFLLLRFSKRNEAGLRHPDSGVRLLCVDFMGLVASWLCRNAVAVRKEESWVKHVIDLQRECFEHPKSDDLHQLRLVVLDFLTTQEKSLDHISLAACRFQVSSMFVERVRELLNSRSEEEKGQPLENAVISNLQVEYRGLFDRLCSSSLASSSNMSAEHLDLKPKEIIRVTRAVFRKSPHGFGNMRDAIIRVLSEAGDRSKNESNQPQVRSRAIKALANVVESDPQILEQQVVKAGVRAALQDESISVREAAVELFGRFIGSNRKLAIQYFDLLCKASKDAGTSVRRRALKLLWECCVRPPDFPRLNDACVQILMLSGDKDEHIQNLVKKIFSELWFMDGQGTGDLANRSMTSRAQSLSQVALSAFERSYGGVLPLKATDPLIVVLKSSLLDEDSDRLHVGRQLAGSLKDCILQSEEGGDAVASQTFPFVLALHALCITNVALLMPDEDSARFIRFLQPYQSQPLPNNPTPEALQKANHQTLCVLSILSQLIHSVDNLETEVVLDLYKGLCVLLKTARRWDVIDLTCDALCKLGGKSEEIRLHLQHLVGVCLSRVNASRPKLATDKREQDGCRLYLFIVSRMCRYGKDFLESESFRMEDCLKTFVETYEAVDIESVKEAALRAVGTVFVSRPDLIVHADRVLIDALNPSSSMVLKRTALKNLTELLKCEEERMVLCQQESQELQEKKSIVGAAKSPARLPTMNGEGDGSGFSSAMLQRVWGNVCASATDVSESTPFSASGSPLTPSKQRSDIRLATLELMEAVLKGGMVAPWTAVSPLVALATDPVQTVAERALRLLSAESQRHTDFFAQQAPKGLVTAYRFQCKLRAQLSAGAISKGKDPLLQAMWGISQLYKTVVQPVRDLRHRFLDGLLSPFDEAANVTGRGGRRLELGLLAFYASITADLPLLKGDEVCSLVYAINQTVTRRGEPVLSFLKEFLVDEKAPADPSTGPSPEPSTPPNQRSGPLSAATVGTPSSETDGAYDAHVVSKAALSLSMLLLLKKYLKGAYAVSDERISMFTMVGDRRKMEERLSVTRKSKVLLDLSTLSLSLSDDPTQMKRQYKTFKALMKSDSMDYSSSMLEEPKPRGAQTTPKRPQRKKNATGKRGAATTPPPATKRRRK
ncbi:hypothetical protein BSKO_08022 [Bryopsis sp. KO-2023]|nr:hypothetical protein BSKO_08022 [Bryopsis sp. KO-2023]